MRTRTFPLAALWLCLCARPLNAAFDHLPSGPRALSMGGAMAALPGDAFGLLYNPASPSTAAGSSAAAAWTLPYADPDLKTLAGGIALHHPSFDRRGAFAAAIRRYGSERWHEQTVTAGYSREIAGSLHAGISVSGFSTGGEGIRENGATGLNAGIQMPVGERVILGVSSFNLNAPSMGEGGMRLPRSTVAGFSCRLASGNLLTTNLLADPERPARLLVAGEFRVTGKVVVMAGVGTDPSIVSTGASFEAGGFRATAAFSRHIDLGTTASLGLEKEL